MHYRRHDTTGKLCKISIKWTQLELGFPLPFYSYSHQATKQYITQTWMITDAFEYLESCNASLIEHDPWTITLPRHNDFFLNHLVYQSNISDENKIIFNEIRIHMKLITASDIVALDSKTKILPNIYECRNHRSSNLSWPNTLPFPSAWKSTWKNILRTIIQPRLETSPLGNWIGVTHQTWTSMTTYTQNLITENSIVYKRIEGGRRNRYEQSDEELECTLLADVTYDGDKIHLVACGTTDK